MDEWNFIAERKIREAMEEGAFDHLEGAGKPLDMEENPFEDPSVRLGHRLLRNNGFAPDWIEELKEIEAESRRLRNPDRGSPVEVQQRVKELNRKIAVFNLKAPHPVLQRPLFLFDS